MLFLFGEILKTKQEPVGELPCPCCNEVTEFTHVKQKYYFTLFLIPLLPLNEAADYWQCGVCKESFEPNAIECPSYSDAIHNILGFLLVGYGFDHLDNARQAFFSVFDAELDQAQLLAKQGVFSSIEELTKTLRKQAFNLDYVTKVKLVEVAYLFTDSVCDIQFNDRVRINLIANSLDVSLGAVNEMVESISGSKS